MGSTSQSAYTTRITRIGLPSGMNMSRMRMEQGYAVAIESNDIKVHHEDPVYLNYRASEAQASLHAQPCFTQSTYGIASGLLIDTSRD